MYFNPSLSDKAYFIDSIEHIIFDIHSTNSKITNNINTNRFKSKSNFLQLRYEYEPMNN
ncbi:hypothetical protein SH2C18_41160 [Clostridium sediminicola]